ncbi:hypothetical protein EVAR_48420_1 [Eumeta japonica]|uniref:Uncharacterized protein n=1 Tax=Eumeta variegata TaxID=151549 RepID=A0A4C1XQE6_EUMVA|nr:hypothetical protein EVAR_48420_1 [Eumeta japonica]
MSVLAQEICRRDIGGIPRRDRAKSREIIMFEVSYRAARRRPCQQARLRPRPGLAARRRRRRLIAAAARSSTANCFLFDVSRCSWITVLTKRIVVNASKSGDIKDIKRHARARDCGARPEGGAHYHFN